MDPQTQNAILQWRFRWQTVTMHLHRAAMQNQGDYPRLTLAHAEGDEFYQRTIELVRILPQEEATMALRFTKHLLDQVARARSQPDTSVVRQMNPLTRVQTGGRIRTQIDRLWLETALDLATPTRIGEELGVSRKKVHREMIRHGLTEPGERPIQVVIAEDGTVRTEYRHPRRDHCPWSAAELDAAVRFALAIFPQFGRIMMASFLRVACHVSVPQQRLRESLQRCAPQRSLGERHRVKRRVYHVAGPNSLWHMDAQLGLRRFGVVIHAFCDGASRVCPGIRASGNNKKQTFLRLFEEAVMECGHPSRMRGDHGRENLAVSAHMERFCGFHRGSFLWGPSVHNIRIERLWVDVTKDFGTKWKGIFQAMEERGGLNVNNHCHIWLLHHLFLPLINRDAQLWRQIWNRHQISRIPGGKPSSPLALFFFGSLHNGVRGISPAGEEVVDEMFGVDWEDIDEHPNLVAHRLSNRPEHLSEVVVEDPECPLTPEEISWLDLVVSRVPHPVELVECLHLWRTGLDMFDLINAHR